MLFLAKILSYIPIFIGAEGEKANLILKFGDIFYQKKKQRVITYNDQAINVSDTNFSRVLAYATHNYFNYFKSTELGRFLMRNLSEGDVFIDIGANMGGYSFLANSLGVKTFCFEPVPNLFEILAQNKSVFGAATNKALSDKNEKTTFYISENVEGSSLVLSEQNQHYKSKIDVDCVTFDSHFKQMITEELRFKVVKIDVEGNETSVVKGMQKALEKKLIDFIWCEVRGASSDRNPNSCLEVTSMLYSYGYDAYFYSNEDMKPFLADESITYPQYFDLLYILKK